MLQIGDIRHTGITVRGDPASTPEKALKAAAPHLDKVQGDLASQLPPNARFYVNHHIRPNGPEVTVTRYMSVVEG